MNHMNIYIYMNILCIIYVRIYIIYIYIYVCVCVWVRNSSPEATKLTWQHTCLRCYNGGAMTAVMFLARRIDVGG